MVGLSVILENYRDLSENHLHQVIRKGSMMKLPYRSCPNSPTVTPSRVFSRSKTMPDHLRPASSSSSGFLECCFSCKQKLLPGKDIYMYKGEMAFCSEDCRNTQIFRDEEESTAKVGCTAEYNCSLAATSSPSSTRSDSSSRRATEGPIRARANAFAY